MVRTRLALLRFLSGFLLLAPFASADTTGQLRGTVADELGARIPGVTVSASSPAQIGGLQVTQTGDQGEFRYPLLAPGDYIVRVELDGFVKQELTAVQVRVDHTTNLLVTMVEATFEDEIVVTETTPVVDPEQTSASQTFTAEYLEKAAIGMDNRVYLSTAGQAPGVNLNTATGIPPTLSVHGSRWWENTFLIDGIDTTAPFDGIHSFDGIGFEAIQEVAVHTAGFEAEYGFATGGVINVVTKSGGNRFSGSFDLRYRNNDFGESGDHFDPDDEPTDRQVLNGSFGGPLLRDRIWFFLSGGGIFNRETPINTPYSIEGETRLLLGKLTWQASPDWLLAARYLGQASVVDRAFGNQFRSPEATAAEEYEATSSSIELTGVLSPSLIWSFQLGDTDISFTRVPLDGDLTTIGHINEATGENYGNFENQGYFTGGRSEAQTDLTWFLPAARGSHQIKAGLRYSRLDAGQNSCFNGSDRVCTTGDEGFLFFDRVDLNGANQAEALLVQRTLGEQPVDGVQRSAYVQDAWRIRPDLTLNLGLRWDDVRQENDVGRQVVDYGKLQPRLGAAWDLRGNGRNIVRAFWGRFMHPSTLVIGSFVAERSTPQEFWLSCSAFISANPATCRAAAEGAGLGYRSDPESWDPAGWFLDPSLVFSTTPGQVVQDLDPMSVDQIVLGFERELFRRTSLELSYVHKDTRDLVEDTCIGNYPEPSPEADCSTFLIANLPQNRRDYEAWVLRFESRALDRLHAIASWVYSESKGSVEGFVITPAFDVFPWHYTNRYGYLADHSRHRVKINGFVDLPWDLLLGFGGAWSSELRWTPTQPASQVEPGVPSAIFIEPRGSRKEDGLHNLDLQLSKGFRFGRTWLQLIGTVYNALDSERPTAFCSNLTGCGEFALGDPIDWQLPRRYELGVRVEF